MTSAFSDLWWYGRLNGPENFATTALALAINVDPVPVTRIVQLLPEIQHWPTAIGARASTQVPVSGAGGKGILDLVLDLEFAGSRRQVWFENKVDAPLAERQIRTYLGAIDETPGKDRPALVVLGRTTSLWGLGAEFLATIKDRIGLLTWQQVLDAIDPECDNAIWRELREYLKEKRMAEIVREPITAGELAALGPAGDLLGKTAEILDLAIGVPSRIPGLPSGWAFRPDSSDAYVRKKSIRTVLKSVLETGELYLPRWVGWSGVELGLLNVPGGLRLGVRLRGGYVAVARALREASGALPPPWVVSNHELLAAAAYATPDDLASPNVAAEWLVARLRELGARDLLRTLGPDGKVIDEETADASVAVEPAEEDSNPGEPNPDGAPRYPPNPLLEGYWTQFRACLEREGLPRFGAIPKSNAAHFSLGPSARITAYILLRSPSQVLFHILGPGAAEKIEYLEHQHGQLIMDRLSPLGSVEFHPVGDKLGGSIWLNGSLGIGDQDPEHPDERWRDLNEWMAEAIEAERDLFGPLIPELSTVTAPASGDPSPSDVSEGSSPAI